MNRIQKIALATVLSLIFVSPNAQGTEGQGLPIGSPDPVTNIVLGDFVGSTTERSVSWTAPASNGGSAITGYTATAVTGAAFDQVSAATCSVNASTTSCSLIGMSFGTTYKIRIVATNAVGSSSPALSVAFTTPAVSQTVTITGAPASVSFGSGPTQLSASATSGLQVAWSSSTTSVCTIDNTGLVTYLATGTCTIVATQDGSGSSYSSASATSSIEVGTNITATATGASSVTGVGATLGGQVPFPGSNTSVTFCISTTNSNSTCGAPSGVTIGTASPSTITSSSGSITSTSVSGLSSSTTYYYWVEASAGGTTVKSSTSSFTTLVAPTISQSGPTSGEQNSFFTTTVTASSGSGVYINWGVDALPAGLALSPSGATATISGTPTAVGTTNSRITVTDSNNLQASVSITFTINAPPPPPPAPNPAPDIDTTVEDPTPTPRPTTSPSPTPSPTPTPTSSPSPSATPTPGASPTPTAEPVPNPGTDPEKPGDNGNSGSGDKPIPDGRNPVRESDGTLPEPKSGEGVLIESGVSKTLTIEVIKNELVEARVGDVVIQIAIQTPDKKVRSVPVSAELTATRGDSVFIAGDGYRPGSKIIAWLFSTPTTLGEIEVGADGKYSGSLPIPPSVDIRAHTLQINGFRTGENLSSLSLRLNVVSEESAPEAKEPSVISGGSENAGDTSGDSGASGTSGTVKIKVLLFKSGVITIDKTNKKRIASMRKARTAGSLIECVGYVPRTSTSPKKIRALVKARATAVCKEFVKVYKKPGKRLFTVRTMKISAAPKSSYKRAGKTQRVDLRIKRPS